MLFHFHLFAFPEVMSEMLRREHPEAFHSLSWYELTDGWYWIDVGETQLFRYTQVAFNLSQPPRSANGCYVDYYVGRFWEDLLGLLPAALEPLPAQLVERLSSFSVWNEWLEDRDTWNASRSPDDADETDDYDEEEVEMYRAAGDWWYQRRVDTGYLLAGPCIWLWSDGAALHLCWDNRDRFLEGVPAWEAQVGERSFPIPVFLTEVAAFHQALIAAMAERVEQAASYWSSPQFTQDLLYLQISQQQQRSRLEHALRTVSESIPTDWQQVVASIATIEENPQFIALRGQHKKL